MDCSGDLAEHVPPGDVTCPPVDTFDQETGRSTYVIGPMLIAGDVLGVGLGLGVGGGMLAWALALTVYSYVQWRNDPDRP